MNDGNDNRATIDLARTVHLCGPWHAAVCVNPDGEESLWLLAANHGDRHGCACPDCAPHDQHGPYLLATTKITATDRGTV